jgi:hypothetical protein
VFVPDYKDGGVNSVETLTAHRPELLDLTGVKTRFLRVVRQAESVTRENRKGHIQTYDRWIVKCDCGNSIEVAGQSLRRDKPQQSCGCKLPPGHIHHRTPHSGG